MQLVARSKPAPAVENPFLFLSRNITVVSLEPSEARGKNGASQAGVNPARLLLAMARKAKRFTDPSLSPQIAPLSTPADPPPGFSGAGGRGGRCRHGCPGARTRAPSPPGAGQPARWLSARFIARRGGPGRSPPARSPPADSHTPHVGNASSRLAMYCSCRSVHSGRRSY